METGHEEMESCERLWVKISVASGRSVRMILLKVVNRGARVRDTIPQPAPSSNTLRSLPFLSRDSRRGSLEGEAGVEEERVVM